jgi:adenosine deaminase
VPEAFLLGNGAEAYSSVIILTTDSDLARKSLDRVCKWFRENRPETQLRALSIQGLADLACAEDHARFEEALYRTYFSILLSHESLHVCLAGGFKTMSAAAQEAAGLLGCESLFHITAPFGIRTDTHEEILAAIEQGEVRHIDLGARGGWPTIRGLACEAPPLPPEHEVFFIESTPLAHKIRVRIEAASRLAASETELATLPFPQVARWSPGERASLDEPLNPRTDADWLLSLPKVELHCHLGGFATHGMELEAVRAAAIFPEKLPPLNEPSPPANWPLPAGPIGLETYRHIGDATGSALLKDPGCLQKHLILLYQHFQSQGILYAELRCSPANYAAYGRSPWEVLEEIRNILDDLRLAAVKAHPNISAPCVNLIIIATRQPGGDFRTHISRHLALAATAFERWQDSEEPNDFTTRVVGVDLAGFENRDTRAHYFRDDFTAALRLGMGITIHAGENDDAEGIWSAILDLNARRLGHALHLDASPTLLRTVADRRIGIEMCPFANQQVLGFQLDGTATSPSATTYPLLTYLRAGVAVTVNTDNIGISNASLTENFLLLPRLCPGIRRLDVLQLLRNAVDQSFLSPTHKNHLLARMTIPHL